MKLFHLNPNKVLQRNEYTWYKRSGLYGSHTCLKPLKKGDDILVIELYINSYKKSL